MTWKFNSINGDVVDTIKDGLDLITALIETTNAATSIMIKDALDIITALMETTDARRPQS